MAIGFIKLTGGVTFWADPESLPSLSLGLSVDGRKAGEVLRADLPDVLWTIAVGADLKTTVGAGEDAAVSRAVVVLAKA